MRETFERIYSIVVRGDNLPVWVAFAAVAVLVTLALREVLAVPPGDDRRS